MTSPIARGALAAVAGALFDAGLLLSGMTDPVRVLGFLDVLGDWDPRLAFVMIGAIAVHAIAYRLVGRMRAPLADARFHLPTRRDLDAPLLAGAAAFGVGWGLAGFCPGPALVAAASGATTGVVFVAAMLAGMTLQHATARR